MVLKKISVFLKTIIRGHCALYDCFFFATQYKQLSNTTYILYKIGSLRMMNMNLNEPPPPTPKLQPKKKYYSPFPAYFLLYLVCLVEKLLIQIPATFSVVKQRIIKIFQGKLRSVFILYNCA